MGKSKYLSENTSNKTSEAKNHRLDRRIYRFLFFLFVSALLWFFNTLSKVYTTELTIPVIYNGIPFDFKPTQPLPTHFTIVVEGNGSTILPYKVGIYSPSIELDLSNHFIWHQPSSDLTTQILPQLYKKNIEKIFNNTLEIKEISPVSIPVTFSKLASKTIKVRFKGKLEFEPQYWLQEQQVEIIPSEIQVSGPKAVIDTTNAIYTNDTVIKDISKPTTLTVSLNHKNLYNFSQKYVSITIIPEKFTEKNLNIPIKVVNQPENAKVMLFPDQIQLKFQIGLNQYDKVKPEDFTAIIDFEAIRAKNTSRKAKIELVEYPVWCRNITFTPREVSFVINYKK
ncbi:MAG TPA: YbbR-like domain-containing protein [Salinivirgaceae bacterium]|nr:YbbR-like domain-containing protein [Salinivirgaceae bacterium]